MITKEPYDYEAEEEKYEDEEEDDLEPCGEWFAFGTERCEFCSHEEWCRKATLEAMKKA